MPIMTLILIALVMLVFRTVLNVIIKYYWSILLIIIALAATTSFIFMLSITQPTNRSKSKVRKINAF